MCMVGALNVGSINLNFEPEFNTNLEEEFKYKNYTPSHLK